MRFTAAIRSLAMRLYQAALKRTVKRDSVCAKLSPLQHAVLVVGAPAKVAKLPTINPGKVYLYDSQRILTMMPGMSAIGPVTGLPSVKSTRQG